MPRRPDPRKSNGTARRRLRARVLREETVCHLCGRDVDTTLPAGLPTSPEVDELLPVSRGGDPLDRHNVRLAHKLCNQRRGNKDLTAPRVKSLRPVETSRAW